jgi:hypothetical protein
MPSGYKLDPNIQMKIEDERAGRLDYVYETSLNANECQNRIGNAVSGKLSEYRTEIKNGILYVSFIDSYDDTGGLFVPPPQKYAVRFESMAEKTIIRVRYVWENDMMNVQYLLKEDIDAFFTSLFDASIADSEKKIWTDSAEGYVRSDPLKIHGSKMFWVISFIFVILWLLSGFLMGITK